MEEAIHQMGSSLCQWSRDPVPSIVEYNMFGLVPGEDLLFLNTILFRLVNVFCSGDLRIRIAVTNVFLSLSSHGFLKNKKSHGILSKDYVHNKNELIQKVEVFLHGEDVTSRSLTLILFGCWADFLSDNADIRHMIFSGMQSPHDFEIKASLFAGGCISEVSEDFALPIVDMIMNIIISPNTSAHIRLAAVRVFSKFGFSSVTANKVFKMGIKMVQGSSDECFVKAMLIAVTNLAATATHLLLDKAMEFLFSFLKENSPSNLKAVLKCVHILLRRVRRFYIPCIREAHVVGILINIMENHDSFSTLQLPSLQLIHEVLLNHLPDIHKTFSTTWESLLKIFTDTDRYPETSVRILALESIIEILGKYKEADGSRPTSLSHSLVAVCFDRVTQLVDFEIETEFHSLLRLLLRLFRQNPESVVFFVDRLTVLTEFVINLPKKDGKKAMIVLNSVYKFTSSISKLIANHGALTDDILQKLKYLADHVGSCNSLDLYTRVLFSLYSHHCTLYIGHMVCENALNFLNDGSFVLVDCLAEREAVIIERMKEFSVLNRDLWTEYKVGRYASVQGAWCTASFIFSRLENIVESNSNFNLYHMWLSILARFSQIEMDVKFVFSKINIEFISAAPLNVILHCGTGNIVKFYERVGVNYDMMLSSLEALVDSSNGVFYFQKWFLKVRFGILSTVLRIFIYLNFIPSKSNHDVRPLLEILSHFGKFADEVDLMRMLFVEMGEGSCTAVSEIALFCSLLAFSAGFTYWVARFTEGCGNEGMLIDLVEDLLKRLGNTDHEICVGLRRFMKMSGDFMMNRSSVFRQSCTMRSGFERGYVFRVCECLVTEFGVLMGDDEAPGEDKLLGALRILFKVVQTWMHMPFTIPNHFFWTGYCAGSELYTSSKNRNNFGEIYVTIGSHLSLDICVQLKNFPNHTLSRLTKLYCILFCTSSLLPQNPSSCSRDSEIDLMIYMNKKLRKYVTEIYDCGAHLRINMADPGGRGGVNSFVSLRPNSRGQGFSTCILDTSKFPEGSYHIKWLSCCVDDRGILRSLLPLNDGPLFFVKAKSPQ